MTIRNTSNLDVINLEKDTFEQIAELVAIGAVPLPSLRHTGRAPSDWLKEAGDLFGEWLVDLVDFEFLLSGIQWYGLGRGTYDRETHVHYWKCRRYLTVRGWRKLCEHEARGARA